MKKASNAKNDRIVDEALELLINKYGDEPWLYDAYQTKDDCGSRLMVEVIDELFVDDVLPRKMGKCYVVVGRVKGKVANKQALTTPPTPLKTAKA